jgi:cytochrome c oxidase subunit 3
MALTLFLALVFTAMQGAEYLNSTFTIMDGVYGSSFYITTGTHGFHVVVGTLFLATGAARA